MSSLNVKTAPVRTHEGAPAKHINPEQQLRRSVLACLLWEDQFYESGESIADRIAGLCKVVPADKIANMAVEARSQQKLRHAPLLLARELARMRYKGTADVIESVIQRPDELTEFLAIYWKDGRSPVSAQVKKGLSRAFRKFDEYQLAKYNRPNAIKLRDVLRICHAKPRDKEQSDLWKRLLAGELETPDTWETALSGGADKKETFERLISEKKLGALAFLRNLRNMQSAGVAAPTLREAMSGLKVDRVLPFRFISAARHAPNLEPDLEKLMFRCLEGLGNLAGETLLLVDVSGSMESKVSGKSEISRMDAAAGVAMLLREICDNVRVITFSNQAVEVPTRRGFALRDAIIGSQGHGGTDLGGAVSIAQKSFSHDRLIVITDEQSHTRAPDPVSDLAYMINVASYQNGVGYGRWTHIDGWSESIVRYIQELESVQ